MRPVLLDQHRLGFSQVVLSAQPTFSLVLVFSSTLGDYHRGPVTCKIFLLLIWIRTGLAGRHLRVLRANSVFSLLSLCRSDAKTFKSFNTEGTEGAEKSRENLSLYFPRIRDRNSSRVLGLSLNEPNIALVTVCELSFSTPRITMHRCRPSTTTPTPSGAIFCWMALAI